MIVSILKLSEFSVCESLLDMESQRQILKCILICGFIIDLHVIVDSFFIREVEVTFLVVGGAAMMTRDVLFFGLRLTFLISARRNSRTEWFRVYALVFVV